MGPGEEGLCDLWGGSQPLLSTPMTPVWPLADVCGEFVGDLERGPALRSQGLKAKSPLRSRVDTGLVSSQANVSLQQFQILGQGLLLGPRAQMQRGLKMQSGRAQRGRVWGEGHQLKESYFVA